LRGFIVVFPPLLLSEEVIRIHFDGHCTDGPKVIPGYNNSWKSNFAGGAQNDYKGRSYAATDEHYKTLGEKLICLRRGWPGSIEGILVLRFFPHNGFP